MTVHMKRKTGTKRFVSLMIAFLFSLTMSAGVWASGEDIASLVPSVYVSAPETVNVKPDTIFDFKLTIYNNTMKPLTGISLSIDDTGILELVEGSETVSNAELQKEYAYKLSVPANPTASKVFLRYSVDYSYELAGKTESGTQYFYAVVNIQSGSGSSANEFSLTGASAEAVVIGENAVASAVIVNKGFNVVTGAEASVLSGSTVLAKKYIGTIDADGETELSIELPAFDTAGTKNLTYKLTYTENGTAKSVTASFKLTVSESQSLLLRNLTYSSSVVTGTSASFAFDLINKSGEEFTNTQVYLYKNDTLLQTAYIGVVNAQTQTSSTLAHTFKTAGSSGYRLEIRYENTAEKTMKLSQTLELSVSEAEAIEIGSIAYPGKITTKNDTLFTFNLINKNDIDFKNAEARILKNGKELANSYIGKVEAQSQPEASVSCVFEEAGSAEYVLRISYTDALGKTQSVEQKLTLNVEALYEEGEDTGALKIQSIIPPVEVAPKSQSAVDFALTNPTNASITGAEAFLYDESGRELNSIYISEVAANTSTTYSMKFTTPDSEGAASYQLRVTYTDTDGQSCVVSKSFGVNVASSSASGDGKPAELKIQKLNNPAAMYTNVSTKVSFVLVNAGKGAAYNTEVYVLDENGEEIAREYIGNIPAAESTESFYTVKYTLSGSYGATFHVEYENYDDSVGSISRAYTQQVSDYRASITDITGYEWMEVGYQFNIEFSVLNNGSETLQNANAILTDGQGNKISEVYIGNIDPSTKKERQRFRNISMYEPGAVDFTITVSYENSDMQLFEFSNVVSGNVNEAWVPDYGDGGGDWGIVDEFPVEGEEGGSLAWWAIALIAGGGALIVAIVIVIVVKKKKKKNKSEDDDIDYFLKQLAVNGKGQEEEVKK